MKVAIVHNDWISFGGGEKVAIEMARTLDTSNTIITRKATRQEVERAENAGIRVLPVKGLTEKPKDDALNRVKQAVDYTDINLKEIDPQIKVAVTTGEYAKYLVPQQDIIHIHYCHTPIRALYDLRHFSSIKRRSFLFKRKKLASLIKFPIYALEQAHYRMIDKVLANSKNVQHRLKKYLDISSEVLYPPVDTQNYRYEKDEEFYLSVQRLFPEKRVEEQIEAFNELDLPLKIVGEGRMEKELKELAKPNIEFLGFVSDEELISLYARCRALVCTAEKEDFGLTPVEAMASGKPVIAVDEGGFRETVESGKTGILFERGKLREAIEKFEASRGSYDPEHIQRHAKKFGVENFRKKLGEIVEVYL